MTQESRSEYAQRMHRVLEHVDRNLDQPLDLETLASVANFSAFHFHRLFSAWMGETLADYVRRRRLELGALRLATDPKATILQVALAVGFNSAEAFSRAFRGRFGASPSEWRKEESKNRQTNRNRGQEWVNVVGYSVDSPNREARMQVKIIERQPVHVVYMRHVGAYGAPISEFWQEVVYPWMLTNNLVGRERYGISHDDPSITESDKLRYDACVAVEPGWKGSGSYHETTIPSGRYAVTRFEGTVAEINDAWRALLRDWLPESGMQLDSRPFFEYYPTDGKYNPKTGVFDCVLCIPVTAL